MKIFYKALELAIVKYGCLSSTGKKMYEYSDSFVTSGSL